MSDKQHNGLSNEAVKEFKEIYKQEFGEDISDDEAAEIAMRLLKFMYMLYGENLKQVEK